MSTKEQLYKLLINTLPYGALFFLESICVDASPQAEKFLNCKKTDILSTSLSTITGEESTVVVDFKLQIQKLLRGDETECLWQPPAVGEVASQSSLYISILHRCDEDQALVIAISPDPIPNVLTNDYPFAVETVPHSAPPSVPVQSATGSVSPSLHEKFHANDQVGENSASAGSPVADFVSSLVPNLSIPPLSTLGTGDVALKERPKVVEKTIPEVVPSFVPRKGDVELPSRAEDDYHDPLTGLPNRMLFEKSMAEFLIRQSNKQVCAAVMCIDLDDFKNINDSLGHKAGDQVIKKIGNLLSGLTAGQPLLARTEADEFALFFPQVSTGADRAVWDAQTFAEKARDLVATPIFHNGTEVVLTASIGISLISDPFVSAEKAVQQSETAMYEAKRKGRNGVAFFDPSISANAQRQVSMNVRLRKAIDNHEFSLYIQPQLCVDTGEVLGGEVLLRWMNGGEVANMPADFIPALEASGLIVDVGRWVIRTACEYIRHFIDLGIWRDHMQLGINVSPRQFKDPQLLEVIRHSMKSYDVDAKYLNFELTENMLVADIQETANLMEEVKSMGASFSIDDFGIGYSSMSYLKQMPFDHLKIDREFIRDIHKDDDNRGVVQAIMDVSQQYGMLVIAEGVENLESLLLLRELGCHSYQGAHFSMPVPCDHFVKLLAA